MLHLAFQWEVNDANIEGNWNRKSKWSTQTFYLLNYPLPPNPSSLKLGFSFEFARLQEY
jgi:hypothetical protein